MKKLIYCAAALATALFAGSCQQELLDTPAGETTVTYSVELPGEVTKAIGDGTNVDELVYELWIVGEDGEITRESTRLYQKTLVNKQENKWIVTLNLVQDQTYKVLFWAQVQKPEGHENYNTNNLTAVTYAANITKDYSTNQEDYAAFYASKVISTFTTPKRETVTLKRPFAQLNIGTDNDVTDYTVTMNTSKVTVAGVPTVFNVATSVATNLQTITFDTYSVPTEQLTVASRTAPYKYVAMNYVFASETGIVAKVSYDINSTLTAKNLDNTDGATTPATISNVIPNVPLQENYRTNIIGNLLSSKTQYDIVIDANFEPSTKEDMEVINAGLVENINGDYEISNVYGFAYAINNLFADGGTFYIHPGVYDFTGIEVEPQATKTGVILNVKANEVPVVTRSTPGFEIIGLDVAYLVSEVTNGSQALFSGLVLPEDTKLVGTNNGVVGVANCSNAEQETGEALISNNDNGEVVNTVSMASVEEINDAIAKGLKLIELTDDITTEEVFTIVSSVIIDGKGNNWTYTGSNRAFDVPATAEEATAVTFKNLNLVLETSYSERGINFNVGGGALTIDNVTVSAVGQPATYAINLPGSSDNSRVTIKDSHIRGNIALNIWGERVVVNATNTVFKNYDTTDIENYSTVVLNNDGATSAEGSVVNIEGGKVLAYDENGVPETALRNDSLTGEINVSETTEVVGHRKVSVAIVDYNASQFYACYSLQEAINQVCKNNNGSVRLIRDVIVDESVIVPAEENVVIDLNGKTLTGTMPKSVGAVVKNNGTLTIQNGTISSTAANGGSAIINNGTLNVKNATINGASVRENGGWPSYPVNNYSNATLENVTITGYQGAIAANAPGTTTVTNCTINKEYLNTSSHVFYIDHADANVVVNGGTYTHKGMDGSLAYVNKGRITVNGGTFSASNGGYGMAPLAGGSIEVYGGDFKTAFKGWGGEIKIYGGTFASKPADNQVAKGYKAVQKNNIFTVIPSDSELVGTADELVAALEANKSVVFANDIKIDPANMSNAYGKTGINVKNGQTIDGNGYTLNIKGAGGTWDSGINTTGGLIKNITVTGSFRGIFINHNSTHSEKVVLENVTIGGNGTVYTISCDQGLYQGIEATNCTFNGWTSFAKTAGEAKFVNCSFGEGSGYKYCRPYSNTEFVNCTFCPGYAVDTTRATVTFTDCTWEE